MKNVNTAEDLIVLVADKHIESTLDGLLSSRTHAIGIRQITYKVVRHSRKDSGCRLHSANFLTPLQNRYRHCLVVFDKEGSGADNLTVDQIRAEVMESLERAGWKNRCGVVVLDPELEIWVWGESRRIDDIYGWSGRIPDLRQWVRGGFPLDTSTGKPQRPKEALEAALKEVGKVYSSALFRQMAKEATWKNCKDSSFLNLLTLLRKWFPAS